MTLRAITVRQPWAWAIVHGGKDVENRTRNIAGGFRGPVAIHAGLAFDDAGTWEDGPCEDLLLDWFKDHPDDPATYPWRHRGAVLGVVDLGEVHPDCTEDVIGWGPTPTCSPWAQSHAWHLCLSNSRQLSRPVPVRGRLGLWTLPDDVEAAVREQVAERLTAVAEARGLTIPDRGPKRVVQHGTDSGYYTHLRRWHTEPCDDCRAAHAEATARRARARTQRKNAARNATRRATRAIAPGADDLTAISRRFELDEEVGAA